MNKMSYLLLAIIAALVIYILLPRKQDNSYPVLTAWLNAGNYKGGFGEDVRDDSVYIKHLAGISTFNAYTEQLNIPVSLMGKPTTVLSNMIDLHKMIQKRKSDKETIPIKDRKASELYTKYVVARRNAAAMNVQPEIKNDKTSAILFQLPEIMDAMEEDFVTFFWEWSSASFWANKGFLIYPANYSDVPFIDDLMRKPIPPEYKWHSTGIFQLATILEEATSTTLAKWKPVPNRIYNFGDLKPPKIKIQEEQIVEIDL